ncbi:hypothetical protein B0H13DRAFT_1928313 [Mycena leptocephala]|nr:hypothetical protein B0H13DRAFT_1928313 [Mycena leptocephala]
MVATATAEPAHQYQCWEHVFSSRGAPLSRTPPSRMIRIDIRSPGMKTPMTGPGRRGGGLHVAFQRAVTSASSLFAGFCLLVVPHLRLTCMGVALGLWNACAEVHATKNGVGIGDDESQVVSDLLKTVLGLLKMATNVSAFVDYDRMCRIFSFFVACVGIASPLGRERVRHDRNKWVTPK